MDIDIKTIRNEAFSFYGITAPFSGVAAIAFIYVIVEWLRHGHLECITIENLLTLYFLILYALPIFSPKVFEEFEKAFVTDPLKPK